MDALESLPGTCTLMARLIVGLIVSCKQVGHLAGRRATEWATSGPLLISIQRNLIPYLTYVPEPKLLLKFEYGLIFGQVPKSKYVLPTDSNYLSNYLQTR